MKKIFILSLVCTLGLQIMAQSFGKIEQTNFAYSTGDLPTLKVDFNKVSANNVTDALKDYLKNYKAKLSPEKGVDGEFYVEEFILTDIDQKPTKMRVKVTSLEGNATLHVNYNVGGSDITPIGTDKLYEQYVRFTTRIANKATFYSYNGLIDTEKAILKDRQRELTSLENEEKKAVESIAKCEQNITSSKSAISNAESALKRQQNVVSDAQTRVNDKEAEIAGMDVKTMEKSIKDIQSENDKTRKDIEKSQENIGSIKGEIAIERAETESMQKALEAKKAVLAITADKKDLKEVKSLESDLTKKAGEVEERNGEIASIESSIKIKEGAIDANLDRINDIRQKIASHNEEALKDQLKLLEKDLKSAESEQKKLEKEIEKEQNSIVKEETKIRDAKAAIEASKVAQATKSTEISAVKQGITTLEKTQGVYKD